MMYIVSIIFKKPLEEVERFIEEHVVFLNKYYSEKKFIVSGRKNPMTGGIILAHNVTLKELKELIKEDSFYRHETADYKIEEFEPTKFDERFKVFCPEIILQI